MRRPAGMAGKPSWGKSKERPNTRPVTTPMKEAHSTVTAVSWSRICAAREPSSSLRTSRNTPPEPTTNNGVQTAIRIAAPNRPPFLPGASAAGKKPCTSHATAAMSTTYSQ